MCRVISMIVLFRVENCQLSICINWPCQHHDNPVGADFTGALRSLSVLTRWHKKDCFWWSCQSTKDVKRLYSKKKCIQEYLELFWPVRQLKWKDRLLLQSGYKQMQTQLLFCLSACSTLSLPPCLASSRHPSGWHVSDILNYNCVKQKTNVNIVNFIWYILPCCGVGHKKDGVFQ